MHILRAALREYPSIFESLAELSARIAGNPVQQGLFVDVNPFWWAAFCLNSAGLDANHPDIVAQHAYGPSLTPFLQSSPPIPEIGDFFRTYDGAKVATEQLFGGREFNDKPFLARIIARELDEKYSRDARENLIAEARSLPLPALVEMRGEARLVAAPGDRLVDSAGITGTLGGFLRDRTTSTVFAVTCGHVAGLGAVTTPAGPLGPCTHSEPPLLLSPGAQCYASCPTKAEQDVSLIDVSGQVVANSCTSVARYVYSHQLVEMVGGHSGRKHYEVGGTGLSHEVGGACWADVFELRLRTSPGILHPNLALLATSPPQPGDSGSWVTDGAEWCGMVTAADTMFGYALESDTIIAKANGQWKLDLVLA